MYLVNAHCCQWDMCYRNDHYYYHYYSNAILRSRVTVAAPLTWLNYCEASANIPDASASISLVQDGINMLNRNTQVLYAISQKFSQLYVWNISNISWFDNGPLLSFQRRLSNTSFYTSTPGDWWCNVIGFVSTSSVSSSST